LLWSGLMTRVVSVWLPQFPIERLRRTSNRMRGLTMAAASTRHEHGAVSRAPLALVEGAANGVRITAVNGTAAAAGVMPGQALADVRAALPALRTRIAEPGLDAAALVELARWAGRYGPSRNSEGSDGLWIDITGIAHLFGGEAALLRDLQRRLSAAGFSARIGVADTTGAAWALARFGRGSSERAGDAIAVAPEGEAKAALADLPVEALRLTQPAVLLLKRLGLYQVGQLYGLPRAALARRFRDAGRRARSPASDVLADGVILRLDQALGGLSEPRRPLAALPVRLVRQVFTEPLISVSGIEAALTAATVDLCALLAEAGEGTRRVGLMLYRTDGTCSEISVGTSSATRDCLHLQRLLAEKLDAANLDLGFGVDGVTLAARVVEALAATQPGLGSKPKAHGAQGLAQLLDRLSNRLDAAGIYRITPRPSHIPEQADLTLAVLAAEPDADPPSCASAPRPPFLLRSPEPITVVAEVPEGPPRHFLWRRARHRIIRAEGPERIEPAWWQTLGQAPTALTARPRDYYRVEDDRGGRYWLFRAGLYDRNAEDGAPVWYVHGLFG
jgi:protein ImuB